MQVMMFGHSYNMRYINITSTSLITIFLRFGRIHTKGTCYLICNFALNSFFFVITCVVCIIVSDWMLPNYVLMILGIHWSDFGAFCSDKKFCRIPYSFLLPNGNCIIEHYSLLQTSYH